MGIKKSKLKKLTNCFVLIITLLIFLNINHKLIGVNADECDAITVSAPEWICYNEGTTGNEIQWDITIPDNCSLYLNCSSYVITRDSVLIDSSIGIISSLTVITNIDGLSPKLPDFDDYLYTCTVTYHTLTSSVGIADHTVRVKVCPSNETCITTGNTCDCPGFTWLSGIAMFAFIGVAVTMKKRTTCKNL